MNEKDQRNYDLQDRLIEFAVRVLNVVESLPNSRVGNHVAGQLIRSGRRQHRIMAKRRAPNLERTSSTK